MMDKAILNAPIPRVEKAKLTPKSNDNRERIRKFITQKTMARIQLRKPYLRRSTRTAEQAQMIYDKETNTSMVQIISKRIWKTSKWTERWTSKTNQHNPFHQERRRPSGQDKRRDVRQFQMRHKTEQRRSQSNITHDGGRQD